MRHMLLAYNKLSFSQVYKLYKSLQHYYHSHYAKPTDGQVGLAALVADDSEMDLTSIEDTVGDRIDKEELDTPLHESELRLVMLFLDNYVKCPPWFDCVTFFNLLHLLHCCKCKSLVTHFMECSMTQHGNWKPSCFDVTVIGMIFTL